MNQPQSAQNEEVKKDIAAWGGNFVVYLLYIAMYFFDGRLLHFGWFDVHRWPEFARFFAPTWKALAIYSVWFAWQLLLYLVLPGHIFKARPALDRADGVCLEYKMNGLAAFITTFVAYYLCAFIMHLFSPTIAIDNLPALLTVVQLWSVVMSLWLWYRGVRAKSPYRSGQFWADFWLGLELNPRSFGNKWDHKYFCAGRPGLNGWVMLNLQLVIAQYMHDGHLSLPMALSCGLQAFYILDVALLAVRQAWVFEPALANILDIYFDRFGFMLVFGDLTYVPFVYSLVCLKLYLFPSTVPNLSWWMTALIIGLHCVGYVLFRGTNWTKHLFKMNPEKYSKRFRYLETPKGKLMLGGFYRIVRHPNYDGDLLMALSWCLCSGFSHLISYYYFIYFVALLVHRQYRDERRCAAKYGKYWAQYCKHVPWRMLPFVY